MAEEDSDISTFLEKEPRMVRIRHYMGGDVVDGHTVTEL